MNSFSLLIYFSGSLIKIPRVNDEANALKALDPVLVLGISTSEKRSKVESIEPTFQNEQSECRVLSHQGIDR
jgi:hypothetical protein